MCAYSLTKYGYASYLGVVALGCGNLILIFLYHNIITSFMKMHHLARREMNQESLAFLCVILLTISLIFFPHNIIIHTVKLALSDHVRAEKMRSLNTGGLLMEVKNYGRTTIGRRPSGP